MLLLAAVSICMLGVGGAELGHERITAFHSDIQVRENGDLRVTETIGVVARGDKIRHGIYRDFPTVYRRWFGARKVVGFEVKEVLRDGEPEGHHFSPQPAGTRLYIGRANTRLRPGRYTYEVTYRTTNQILFGEEHDELNWNVTGTGWDFPIEQASATVRLPGVPRHEIQVFGAYTGRHGQEGRACEGGIQADGTVQVQTTRRLMPGENLTVAVGWPKGYVAEPPMAQKALTFLKHNWGFVVAVAGAIAIVAYYLVAWHYVGRDPEAGVVIPLFEPPEDLSPAAARFVRRMGYDQETFTAALINIAVKGYVSIHQDGDGDYTVRRAEAPRSVLSTEEKKIAGKLLGRRDSLKLEQSNHARIGKALKAAKTALRVGFEKTHFLTNKAHFIVGLAATGLLLAAVVVAHAPVPALFLAVWLAVWSVGTIGLLGAALAAWRSVFATGRFGSLGQALWLSLIALPFLGGEIFAMFMLANMTTWAVPVIAASLAVINVLFYHLLKAPTLRGRRVLDRLEGFRMYLAAAEKDRLNVLNPPERTPELFERYLPYALALEVEQEWSEQFAGVLERAAQEDRSYSPGWYHGTGWSPTRPGSFAGSLSGSFSSAISSASAAPRSASGGGGFSGGGGGGGGGGGW